MAKKKKDYNVRCRNHFIVLYEDNIAHKSALEFIENHYNFVAIKHDRDYYDDSEHKEDEKKKVHYHIIVNWSGSARQRTSIAKELNIEENLIEPIDNIEKSFRYLLHLDNEDKTKYSKEELFGNLVSRALKYCTEKIDLNDFTNNLLDWLNNQDYIVSVQQVLRYACSQNGVGYLRNISYWHFAVEEHNEKFKISSGFEK